MKTILIVDDTYENLYLLRVILEEAGFLVIEAKDGKEGLEKLHQNNLDLIISDILMPVMDGYMFCQACKKDKLFKHIPFVFYTSTYTEKLDEDFALKLGAVQFLRKPTDQEKILEVIQDIFAETETQTKAIKKLPFTEQEVLKLYSKRLISKLEQKNLDLEKEISERKKAQQALINENEILDLIATNTSLNKILDHILLNYESHNPEFKGSISLLHEDGVHLDLISAPSLPKDFNLALKRVVIGKNVGSCGTAAFIKKSVIVSDINTDKLWKDYKDLALNHNLKSCWSVPILSENNKVLGAFAIYSDKINTPSFEDIRELSSSVRLAKIAIEKFKIVKEVKKEKDFSTGLLKSMREGLVVINLNSKIISVNPSFCEMTGFSEEELIGIKRPYPFLPPELKKENDERYKLFIEGKLNRNFESIYMHKNGNRFPVHILFSSMYNEEGVKTADFATVQDITERRKAELDLKLAKKFNDKLIMSMQEGLIIVDLDGKIMMVNDSTCKILGYSKEELIGMELPYPFAKKEDFKSITRTNEKVAEGKAPAFYFDFIRKNGEMFLASFLAGNIKNDKGEVIALFGTMKDISEEEKAKKVLKENAMLSNKKKDVILKLANLVGENFNTSLQSITKLAAKTLNIERVSVWSFNDDKNEIFCEKLYQLKSNQFEQGYVIKYSDNPNYFMALDNNHTILIEDAQKDSITKKFTKNYFSPNSIVSLMDVSINSTKGKYGIICFEHVGETLRNWTAEEQEFAISITSIVSLMVESAERKLAENKLVLTNEELSKVNSELNVLRNQLEQENVYLRNELDLVFNYEEMVYGSIEFSDVLTETEKVAPTNATVLLLGESGTGKELLARAIHNISKRNGKPLIKVNCSAIPRDLIESELFGHKKGSFTGAFSDKVGKFELADGGTLFLDEIGELPLDMQPKILRFLQEGEIEVVGGTGLKKLDVRVIAATNRNLKEAIDKKEFREDLYFRLNVFPIEIPPLRKRKDDIPLLVEHFVDKFNKAYGKSIKYVSDEAMEKLKIYDWPGNIRELENLIERASILSTNETLLIPGFESSNQITKAINQKDLSLDAVQRNHILQVLQQSNWKISGVNSASELLNLKPSTLRDKMTKLGLKKPIEN